LGIRARCIISKRKGRIYYRVQWGDVILYTYLEDIGLMPNKSLRIGEMKVPDDFFFDFLRGHYDGDGCFYSYHDPRWPTSFMYYLSFISASREHVDWIRSTLQRLLGVSGAVSGSERSIIFQLRYAKREANIVLAKLYENPSVICLERKRLKIQSALRIVGESLPGWPM